MRLKLVTLSLLLAASLGITMYYDVDLQVLYQTSLAAHRNLREVYTHSHPGRFFYGPVSLVAIYPMAWLSFSTLKVLWVALQTACFFAFWLGMARLFPWITRPPVLPWLALFAVSANPIHNNFQSGNIQLILATALVWAEVLHRSSRRPFQYVAGIVTALAAAIKVFPGFVVLYYVCRKERNIVAGLCVGILLAVALPAIAFGPFDTIELFRGFFINLTDYSRDNPVGTAADILCLPSLIARYLPTGLAAPLKGILVLGISIYFFVNVYRSRSDSLLQWSLAMALCVFLNPSSRPHYFIFYVPAFAYALDPARRLSLPGKVWILISIVLIAFTVEAVTGKRLNDALEYLRVPVMGMVMLASWLLGRLSRTSDSVA